MGIPKGYKKTSDDMKFFYSSPRKKSKTKPKDSLPKGTTAEKFNKKEIGIRFKTITGAGNLKHKVPECFNAASNKTGRMDMSRLMQGGSAIGGSIESQSGDQGYTNYSFGSKWEGK